MPIYASDAVLALVLPLIPSSSMMKARLNSPEPFPMKLLSRLLLMAARSRLSLPKTNLNRDKKELPWSNGQGSFLFTIALEWKQNNYKL